MPHSILILDDDDDLRSTLADVMHAACAVDCVCAADVDSMIREGDRALACSVAIIDVNLGIGQPSGLVAQQWLTEHGFHGRIVLLTGHARTHPLVQQAMQSGGVDVLQKPTSIKTLCGIVEACT